MGLIFYNIFLVLFRVFVPVASLFSPKARLWLKGRKNIFSRLRTEILPGPPVIWFHCASLGEFEQGRPVIEEIRRLYPRYRILLTFFSPSGFEVRKNYEGADWVFYMPLDGSRSAKKFLEIVKPSLVIFIKYEFWFYYLKKAKYRNIPVLLVSAAFRKEMGFFQWYGGLQRKMLTRFEQVFVQDESSKSLLDDAIALKQPAIVIGDTRFDRVVQVAGAGVSLPVIEEFIGNGECLVAGSTWPRDEALLGQAFGSEKTNSLKLIIAPHDVSEKRIREIAGTFPGRTSLYSNPDTEKSILIIDNVGLLSALYRYAAFCYVGGGLDAGGVHNILEAAVYGRIVFFGPNHTKYLEANALVRTGAGIVVTSGEELSEKIESLRSDQEQRSLLERNAKEFVRLQTGATGKILHYIQEKRLLTN